MSDFWNRLGHSILYASNPTLLQAGQRMNALKAIAPSLSPQQQQLISFGINPSQTTGNPMDQILAIYLANQLKIPMGQVTMPQSSSPNTGKVLVRDKQSGQTGYLDSESEFDPNLYDRL